MLAAVYFLQKENTVATLLWLSSAVRSHGAGKQSMRHVLFSIECPGAKKWACCHPGGFECFITAYTKDQLPTARSLTSGQQCRQSRRGSFHCPATAPASTCARARQAQHEGWLAASWTPGTASHLSCLVCLIIQEFLTMAYSSEAQKQPKLAALSSLVSHATLTRCLCKN